MVQGVLYFRNKIRMLKLTRAYVDRHMLKGQACIPPGFHLPAGRLQHPVSDGQDQAGFIGHRNKVSRGDMAPVRLLPAQQCLDTLNDTIGVDWF